MDNAYQGMENGIKPILHSLLAVYTLSMTASKAFYSTAGNSFQKFSIAFKLRIIFSYNSLLRLITYWLIV